LISKPNNQLLKASTTTKKIDRQEKKLLKPATQNKTIQTKLQNLTKDNIDDIAKSITTDKTKLAQVKQVIQKYLKEY
jgi:peptidoglycan hydrolase CwlO-like protein